ncbi:MAG: hypothetical protein ABL925_03045 [Methylococcales bacterium]
MNRQTKILFASALIVGQCAGVAWAAGYGRIVVANRTSGTLSIINENTDALERNVSVAGKFSRPPEPMYVNYVAKHNRLLVNDRANKQIIAMNADTYKIINTVKTGSGAFHMWSDGVGKQTWSVNDVDKSFTIINPKTMQLIKTLPIPADLKEKGGKPHDILLDKAGKWAITTIVGVGATTDPDYVVQYSTKNFKEIARQPVGKDPHVGVLNDGKLLFVPTQNASKVYVMDPNKKLQLLKTLDVPGAHGAAWMPNGKYFYTSNLPKAALDDGNKDMLWAIDAKALEIAGHTSFPSATADAGLQAAHNLTVNAAGTKLYLTHSGHEPGNQVGDVTVYSISDALPVPLYTNKRIAVGLNPFGIGYIPGK